MNVNLKRFLAVLVSLFLLCPAAIGEKAGKTGDAWICLNCGQETAGDQCAVCGEFRDFWTCMGCRTANLSPACRNCGKEK